MHHSTLSQLNKKDYFKYKTSNSNIERSWRTIIKLFAAAKHQFKIHKICEKKNMLAALAQFLAR